MWTGCRYGSCRRRGSREQALVHGGMHAIIQCSLELFRLKNVRLEKDPCVRDGSWGSIRSIWAAGVVHQMGNAMVFVVPVHLPAPGTDLPSPLWTTIRRRRRSCQRSRCLQKTTGSKIRDPVPDPLTGRQLLAVLFVFFLEILPPAVYSGGRFSSKINGKYKEKRRMYGQKQDIYTCRKKFGLLALIPLYFIVVGLMIQPSRTSYQDSGGS